MACMSLREFKDEYCYTLTVLFERFYVCQGTSDLGFLWVVSVHL